MKFDYIIGNPPYQEEDGGGGAGRSATSVYPAFLTAAIKLNPEDVIMIMPSRWFNGGKGLDSFRAEMLSDQRISKIVEFSDSKSCFPAADIAGGVCYLLWDKEHSGDCEITNVAKNGDVSVDIRSLNEYSVLVSNNKAISVVRKVMAHKETMMSEMVSSRRPFGLDSSTPFDQNGDTILRSSKGTGKIKRSKICQGNDLIDKWKVITSKVCFEHAGIPDNEGMMRVLSVVQLMPPNSACTESYLVNGAFDNESEAKNFEKYLKTKFVRFLLMQMLASMNMTRTTYCFVPIQDFTKEWTDEELYRKYEISEDEIAYINSVIRPM